MSVFLSYSRDDVAHIETLREDLTDAGYDVWHDERLSGGQEWWDAILDRIRRADVVALAVTAASIESEACISEIRYADSVGRTVIPVRLAIDVAEDMTPHPLPRLQWVSYVTGDKADLKQLLRAVREAPQQALPDPLPEPPPLPMSYVSELRELVHSEHELDRAAQVLLLDRFESRLPDARNADKLAALLAAFRGRDDLRANLVPKIDALLAQLAPSTGLVSEPAEDVVTDVSGDWEVWPSPEMVEALLERGVRLRRTWLRIAQSGRDLTATEEHNYFLVGDDPPRNVKVHLELTGTIVGGSVRLNGHRYAFVEGDTQDEFLLHHHDLTVVSPDRLEGVSSDEDGSVGSVVLQRREGATSDD